MKIAKTLYKLSLIAGLLIVIVGVFMKFNNLESHGLLFPKAGSPIQGTINGNDTIIIGSIILVFTILFIMNYIDQIKSYEIQKSVEKSEKIMRSKYKNYDAHKVRKAKATANRR